MSVCFDGIHIDIHLWDEYSCWFNETEHGSGKSNMRSVIIVGPAVIEIIVHSYETGPKFVFF